MQEIKATFEVIGLKAGYSIGLLNDKHVLIRFHHEDDYRRIWLKEQWYMKGFPMRGLKWTPDFRVGPEPSIAPV